MKSIQILFPMVILIMIFGYVVFEHELEQRKVFETIEQYEVNKQEVFDQTREIEVDNDVASSTTEFDVNKEFPQFDDGIGTSTSATTTGLTDDVSV